MKRFKKLVGLLLCVAMVLSIVPASIISAAELGAETEWVMQKIDLTDCIVSACSNNFNSSNSYRDQDWYTNDHSDWKDFNALVDGYYYNEVYFGCTHPERADLYIDLTEKYGDAVPLDQLKVYHGGFGAVPSLYVALVLEGGTKIEKSFTLGWEAGVEADPLTWTFDETYDIEGVYIWQNGNAVKAYFGEIELLSHKEIACEVVEIVDLDTPTFGYYADGDTNGTITEYYDTSYGPANLIDGDHDTYTRSLSYTYSEIQNEEKIPAILFDLGEEFSLAGVEVNGYQYGYYNMCDFTIQVYDSTGTWTTVKTVKKAFDTSVGTAGEDTEPVMYRFDAIVGSKVRILVNGVNDMGDEDPDQKVSIDGFCVREIALYNGYGEAPEDGSDADNTPSILDDLIVMESAPTPTVGYYTDNNTDGVITDYYNSTHTPANMVNGDITDQSRSEYYTHAEIASGAKVPVILFDFESTTVLGGLDIYGYQTSRYNMEDFEIQVYTSEGWVTAASVTDAFYEEGSFGDDLSGPLTVAFDQLYTGTQVRILVSGISDMTPDAAEDAEMAEGGYIRIREIEFYSEEAPGPYIETATVNGVDLSEYVIVYSADEPDYNLRAAQHIRSAIKKRTGRVLTIVEDDTAEVACEILVGDTNRSLSQSVTAPGNNEMKFTIQTSGTKIALEADYFIIAGAAYYFTETYINNASFDVTVSDVTRAPITEKANNYIMLIGDGMGVNQTKLFEAYDVPTSGDFAYSDGEDIFYGYYLPYYGLVETCNSSGTTTDSAAAGTALATGYKTVNTWIGVDASGNSVQSLTELALSLGMGAAVMSTEEVTGATPASFSSHVSARSDSSGILADQAALRAQGAIIYDEDYYPYYTAEEWASAEPAYIKTLNQVAENDSFFLMYEEAYIDKNGHYSNAPWCFRTMYRFNQAIGFFMEFAMYNPDTLVVITADHETGNMDSTFTFDGGGSHSNQDVPIFAYGVGASAFDTDSSYHNTSIARTFAYMMTGGDTSFGDSQWPILTASDEEPVEPEDPDPTTPTEPPADGTMQKIDLTGTVVGVDSQNSATESDFTKFTWYSDADPTWKDITIPVNGNYDDEIHWGLDSHERGDIYLDLTRIDADGVAASQLKLYHSKYRDVPSLVVILKLADGSFVEKTFTLGWKQDVAADPFVYTFDETYTVTGVYLWENQSNENLRPTFGEIEMFYRVGDEPATPPTTEPAGTMEKIDLTNSVVGCDSQDSATQSDYSKLTWYSTLNPGWKELSHFTDGDYSNEVHWGLDDWERADVYIDLTKNTGSAVAVDQFKLYHSTYRDVGSVYFALILADGTVVDNTATLNWKQDTAADPYVYTYDQTYTAVGLYVWQPDNNPTNGIRAAFGEIELWKYEDSVPEETDPTEPTEPPVTEPTTPVETEPTEAPTAPAVPSEPIKTGNILQIVPASKITTQFGYYSDFEGDDESTFVDCNDGYCVTDGWYGRAGYSECTSADGLIALVMTLDEAKTLGAIELIGKNEENNPKCFDVQAMIDGEWVSVVSRTDDTFVSGMTQMFDFRKTVTTSKLRILIYAVADAENECYLNEVTLYEATTGNVSQIIDLTGKDGHNDASPEHPIADLVDNDKRTEFLGSIATFDLTVDGQATAVDGFNLYAFRADADGRHTLPAVVTVQIEKVPGGEYETIGTFETGWVLDGITDVLTAKFDQTYMAYSIKFTFDNWSYANELELLQYVREAEPVEPDTILVGASYSIHLIEPWALRVNVQFAENTIDNLIPVANFTSYGAYAIIGNKFEGATAEELMADPDAVKYTKAGGDIKPGGEDAATTLTFDFYDGLYSFNLDESIYWVVYFEDTDGIHYTGVQSKSLIAVAEALLADQDVPASEKAVLNSMKEMKDSITALRGANADLGHIYPAGAANPGTLGDRNTGYQFGAAHQMKLIEPWGVRVRVLMRDKTAPGGVYADYESADDYGLIFFHDKTNKYGGTMTAEQLNAETDAKVFSKQNDNAWINGNGVTAIYDHEIHTYQLDSELYCLPYIVVDGEYYYPSAVICWNLLDEMIEFSQNENLSDEEIAAFEAILTMYENVQNHLN